MGDGMSAMLLREKIGEELREIRTGKNLTLREVSIGALVSYSYLSEVERGQKEVSSELLSAICGSLDVRISDVLFGASEKIAQSENRRRLDSRLIHAL